MRTQTRDCTYSFINCLSNRSVHSNSCNFVSHGRPPSGRALPGPRPRRAARRSSPSRRACPGPGPLTIASGHSALTGLASGARSALAEASPAPGRRGRGRSSRGRRASPHCRGSGVAASPRSARESGHLLGVLRPPGEARDSARASSVAAAASAAASRISSRRGRIGVGTGVVTPGRAGCCGANLRLA